MVGGDVLYYFNLAALAGNVFLFVRALQYSWELREASRDFSRRIRFGHVLVVGADTGRVGTLKVTSAGDDRIALYIDTAPDGWRLCSRCFEEATLVPAGCPDHPERLPRGQGLHKCSCGAVLIAGNPHPPVCQRCRDGLHPALDTPD